MTDYSNKRRLDENDTSKTVNHLSDGSFMTENHSSDTTFKTINNPSDSFDTSVGSTEKHTDEPIRRSFVLQPGNTLLGGRYKVLQVAGKGGMGVVYQCLKVSTGETVALKTVLSGGRMSATDADQFRKNYNLVKSLNHDNIIRVNAMEIDEITGQRYIEMEWVEGEDLVTHFLQFGGNRQLIVLETLRILKQIAAALDYAHSQGVTHRDVKDANIMIDKTQGKVLLIDFGVASREMRPLGTTNALKPEMEEVMVDFNSGTPGYQSPEQWQGQRPLPVSDQYSLAVTAYRCLAGHLPFDYKGFNESIFRDMVLYDPMPPVRWLSEQANAVLAKAMSKRPEDRYKSCTEFIEALGMAINNVAPAIPQQPSIPHPSHSQGSTHEIDAAKSDSIEKQVSVNEQNLAAKGNSFSSKKRIGELFTLYFSMGLMGLAFILMIIKCNFFSRPKLEIIPIIPLFIGLIAGFLHSRVNRYAPLFGCIINLFWAYDGWRSSMWSFMFISILSCLLHLYTFIQWNKRAYKYSTILRRMTTKQRWMLFSITPILFIIYLTIHILLIRYTIYLNVCYFVLKLIFIFSMFIYMFAFIEYPYLFIIDCLSNLILNALLIIKNEQLANFGWCLLICNSYKLFCFIIAFFKTHSLYVEQQELVSQNKLPG